MKQNLVQDVYLTLYVVLTRLGSEPITNLNSSSNESRSRLQSDRTSPSVSGDSGLGQEVNAAVNVVPESIRSPTPQRKH
jgi:hypothetical protein